MFVQRPGQGTCGGLTQRPDEAPDGVHHAVGGHQVSIGDGDLVDVDGVVPLKDRQRCRQQPLLNKA